MLVIRMQRTGRKGHAMFRVVVQDSRRTPTSGKIVAGLGSYDPHTKNVTLDKEKASFYLSHGAQPSERVARLLKTEGVELPSWVIEPNGKQRTVRNADKRRSTAPAAPVEEASAEPAAEEPAAAAEDAVVEETPATESEVAEEAPATEPEAVAAEPEAASEPEVVPESDAPVEEAESAAEAAPADDAPAE